MRPDGHEYYEMLLFNVDDIMIISHLGDEVARQIGDFYKDQGIESRSAYLLLRGVHGEDSG